MSEVWLAEDEELERPVALKLLAPPADPVRFEREAQAVAALSDPNIERIYAYGEHDGRPYMALEYLRGDRSLTAELETAEPTLVLPRPPRHPGRRLAALAAGALVLAAGGVAAGLLSTAGRAARPRRPRRRPTRRPSRRRPQRRPR